MASKARAFQLACRSRVHRVSPTASSAHITSTTPVARNQAPRPRRTYATSPSGPPRRAITVTTDDGRYAWSDLSAGEKAARGTQQTINFALVAAGLLGTLTVSYLLYVELLAPSSHTVQFNAAVDRIKASPECRALLGPSSSVRAFGEPTSNKWARPRPLAHTTEHDRSGNTHFRMHFNVEGSQGAGVVVVHMVAAPGRALEYKLLSLSVKGQETVYLEGGPKLKERAGKMFGVAWR